MVIDFSKIGIVKEQPALILCNADGKAIQTLGYAYNLEAKICYNEASTITFDIPAYVDGNKTPNYDNIIGMRIIDMNGWGRFILMNPSINNDGVKEIKSCKAFSLEYELTYKKIFFEEATYNFWNPLSPEGTVLGMIMEDLPSWTIGSVDEDLVGRYRTFSANNTNIYNFMKSTLQKSYSCIFDFDTYTRTINVRSTANEAVSKPVYLSMDNLVKEIDIDEDTENIFTVLDVSGGEDVNIRMVNPLGTNKIYNLDYFMNTSHFDQNMIDKWNSWKKSFETNQLTYYNTSIERMLKTSALSTERATLNELKNTKLAALKTERSVYVEHLAPTAAGGNVTEPSTTGTGYTRVQLTSLTSPTDGVINNSAAISFPESSTDWFPASAPAQYYVIYDAQSGGNLLMYNQMTTSRVIETNTIATIKANSLYLQLTD